MGLLNIDCMRDATAEDGLCDECRHQLRLTPWPDYDIVEVEGSGTADISRALKNAISPPV